MPALLNFIETALYSALTGNANLAALTGSQVFDTQAAPGTGGNYVIFQYVSGGDENANGRESVDVVYRVECISQVRAQAAAGAGYIHDTLHNGTLNISGWTAWRVEQERLFNMVEDVLGSMYWRKGGMYRISIDNE